MTNKEMTELFALMLLAWPNAETFKGGITKLAPTIKLWTSCTTDVDFWTGQQAVIRLCQKCKFPPTIAEFREQVGKVDKDVQALISRTVNEIRSADCMFGSTDALYGALPPESFTRKVIDAMGGPNTLVRSFERGGKINFMWNLSGIENACRSVVRKTPALADGKLPALSCKDTRKEC